MIWSGLLTVAMVTWLWELKAPHKHFLEYRGGDTEIIGRNLTFKRLPRQAGKSARGRQTSHPWKYLIVMALEGAVKGDRHLGGKNGVVSLLRAPPVGFITYEQGKAASFFILHAQWPLCSASCFYWGCKNITETPAVNRAGSWGHSNMTSQGPNS